eukprot:g5831.t1
MESLLGFVHEHAASDDERRQLTRMLHSVASPSQAGLPRPRSRSTQSAVSDYADERVDESGARSSFGATPRAARKSLTRSQPPPPPPGTADEAHAAAAAVAAHRHDAHACGDTDAGAGVGADSRASLRTFDVLFCDPGKLGLQLMTDFYKRDVV